MSNIVPITDLRRNFGSITANLPYIEELLLTKDGKPFATLRATTNIKKDLLMENVGAWEGTDLDNDDYWKKALSKKSRKSAMIL
jgi:hypothetical protein